MRGGEEGFTLLEVMIALAVVGTALVVLIGLGNRSIFAQERIQCLSQGVMLAQRAMSEVEVGSRRGGSFGESKVPFDPPFEEYSWSVSYEDAPIPAVRLVRVVVAWGEKVDQSVELVSFVPAEGR